MDKAFFACIGTTGAPGLSWEREKTDFTRLWYPFLSWVGLGLVTPNLHGSLFGSFSRLTPNLTVGLGNGEDQESKEKHHGRGMDPV